MKKAIAFASIVVATGAFAVQQAVQADATPGKPRKPRMTMEERAALHGGFVVYPNSQKGAVAFVDAQEKVMIEKELESLLFNFKQQFPIKIDLVKSSPGDPATLKASAKADFAIIFVDDEKAPSMAIYPEDGIAVVNFAKYTKALKLPNDREAYEKRCAKGALKAFIMLCNGGGSRYPGNVATTHSPEQLDLAHDKLPMDIQDAMRKYLEAAGVTPKRRTVYRRAVQEGWARPPTNDVQKAIWDEIHSLPSEPIKIKPETKKVQQ